MPQPQKISTAELRRQNRNNVYRYFYHADSPKTKQDIAQALSLSLPTVTQNLRELLEEGLIAYAGLVDSSGGRRARSMQLIPDARIAIGIELSPRQIRLEAIDLLGHEIASQCLSCDFVPSEAYGTRLAQAVEEFSEQFSLSRDRLLGIGLALPGIINEKTSHIETAPVLGIHQLPFSVLTDRLPAPALIVNDASAGGFAECWNRKNTEAMAYLSLGKGVGGALILNGHPYAGQNLRSAEFGHICIVPDGQKCSCGQRGCLEAYCSIARLSDDLDGTIEDFFARLSAKDPVCEQIWEEYLSHLTRGIHTIRMITDCEIVLGGSITPFLSPYLERMQRDLAQKDSFGADGTYLHLGTCGAKASATGAALYFVSRFLDTL